MPITKNASRQDVSLAYVDINYSDISSGVAAVALELPPGAVVVGGALTTLTAFNAGTSDVMSVGDSGSANRYLSGSNIHATGRAALVPTGFTHTGAIRNLTVTWTAVGAAATAGKVRLEVQYYVENRASFTQG